MHGLTSDEILKEIRSETLDVPDDDFFKTDGPSPSWTKSSAHASPPSASTPLLRLREPAPDPRRILPENILGVSALIFADNYNDQEFVRVGYYQNTKYDDEVS